MLVPPVVFVLMVLYRFVYAHIYLLTYTHTNTHHHHHQGLGSPSGARATPLSTDTTGIGGPLAAAGPTGLGRAPAAAAAAPPSGGMLFGQFGDLSTSPPTKGGVQMPTSTVTAVAAAESVVMEGPSSGQPGSYEEQRLFMQARAAQKKEVRGGVGESVEMYVYRVYMHTVYTTITHKFTTTPPLRSVAR